MYQSDDPQIQQTGKQCSNLYYVQLQKHTLSLIKGRWNNNLMLITGQWWITLVWIPKIIHYWSISAFQFIGAKSSHTRGWSCSKTHTGPQSVWSRLSESEVASRSQSHSPDPCPPAGSCNSQWCNMSRCGQSPHCSGPPPVGTAAGCLRRWWYAASHLSVEPARLWSASPPRSHAGGHRSLAMLWTGSGTQHVPDPVEEPRNTIHLD